VSTATAHPVVGVDHLTKRYTGDLRRSLRYAVQDIRRELLPRWPANGARPGEFAALDDVSFELRPGEALAVLGRNGAGKSTLLKVLYGLIKPDGGEARLRGRVGALIELGTGFDPVLSGRENIAVNASILGLSAAELEEATANVLDFAELGDAADMPLRYYSTGMKARLAFAVAAHLRPDVLLVDEVLAVGDFAFQRKCYRHMRRFVDEGGALVLVSHNVFLAQMLCTRGMLLDRGSCVFEGSAVDTVAQFLAARQPEDSAGNGHRPSADEPVVIEALEATRPDGGEPATGRPLVVTLRYRCAEPLDVIWGFSIWTGEDWVCVAGDYDMSRRRIEGSGELRATIPRLPLVAGTYVVRAVVNEAETAQPLALYGHYDQPPLLLRVGATPNLRTNAMAGAHQLVTIDVDWD
jgi:lipopolysaccharide transport system ATP-binding protein